MTTRCCPNCARRFTMLVDPDCPLCDGTGVMELGRPALARFGDEPASRAVELVLEGQARRDLADPDVDLQTARTHLTMSVAKMRLTGMLARTPGEHGQVKARKLTTAQVLHQAAVITNGYHRGDSERLDRPALNFEPDDRPLANGGMPGFSLGFRVCALSRVADPIDPLRVGQSIRDVVTGRFTTEARAKVLAATSPLFDELGRPTK